MQGTTGATGSQGATGAQGEPGNEGIKGATGTTGPTGVGLTEAETVTSGGTGTALVGNLAVKHILKTGEYELTDEAGGEPALEGCAVVVTVNATELEDTAGAEETAQASVTGEHRITVMTYEVGSTPTPTENSFSLMVTCP